MFRVFRVLRDQNGNFVLKTPVGRARKKYYVYYYKNFSNCYVLFWTDNDNMVNCLPSEAKRITRKEAEHLCAEENNRKRYDSAMAGYGANTILPADYDCFGRDISEDGRYFLDGYIWERSNYVD